MYEQLSTQNADEKGSAGITIQPVSSPATEPPPEVLCRICGSGEDGHLLIVPCNCSGSLAHVHTTCLQMWISTRPQRNAALPAEPNAAADDLENGGNVRRDDAPARLPGTGAAGDEQKMICEICHSEYRLTVEYTYSFECTRCMRCESLGHVFEIVVLLIMLGVSIAMWPILNARIGQPGGGGLGTGSSDAILVPIVSCLMIALSLFTLYKVVKRWIRANSIVTISPRTQHDATPTLIAAGTGTGGVAATAESIAAANAAANRARLRPVQRAGAPPASVATAATVAALPLVPPAGARSDDAKQ